MSIRAKNIIRERSAARPNTAVKDIARRIISTGQPGLPVINETSEVVGIVTELNVLEAIQEGLDLGKITAERIMTKEPVTADLETSRDDLIQMMLLNNLTMIPIVSNEKYIGTVSRQVALDAFLSPDYYLLKEKDRSGFMTWAWVA